VLSSGEGDSSSYYYYYIMASTSISTLEQRLRELLRERSVTHGDFILASGRRSSFYIDARRATMSGEGLVVIGALGLARLAARGWVPDLVGGLTLGADPVAYALAVAARARGGSLDAFSVRKQAKTHGSGKRIEGCFTPGAAVVVVEDVITTGHSAAEAIAAVIAEGGRVLGVLAVVDREEGGRTMLEQAGHPVEALVTATELGLR
jgi:orotate phosphoribosyltransferase